MMRKITACLWLCCVFAIAGCASRPPSAEDMAGSRFNSAQTSGASGDYYSAAEILQSDLTDPGEIGQRARLYLGSLPDFESKFLSQTDERLGNTSLSGPFRSSLLLIDNLSGSQVVSPSVSSQAKDIVSKRALEALETGRVTFQPEDLEIIPGLSTPEVNRKFFDGLLLQAQSDAARAPNTVRMLLELAVATDPGSYERDTLGQHIEEFKLPRELIEKEVAALYPDAAARMKDALVVSIWIASDDRLLREDLGRALRKRSKDIDIVERVEQAEALVKVSKLEWTEYAPQPVTRTISYSEYEVDTMKAVLLMPRNASYMYEYTEGRSEVTYAFEIIVRGVDGADLANKLERGTVSRSFSSCSNARVVNVFGGVEGVDWAANDDMNNHCVGSTSAPNPRVLRDEVWRRLAQAVTALVSKSFPSS